MAEPREATMSRNAKLMPLSLSDEIKSLCKSQRIAHFEKTLSASSVYFEYLKGRQSVLTLPARFVEDHSDKIRKSVILRPASSTESWTVRVSVCLKSPSTTQVRFCGGWGAFAVSNGLSKGDSLIFALTAVSEFKVYAFSGKSGNPKEYPPSRPPRGWFKDSKLARKKAKQSRAKQLAAEGDVNGTVKSSGLIAETKIIRDSKEIWISVSGHSPTSCRVSFHVNAIDSEKAHNPSH